MALNYSQLLLKLINYRHSIEDRGINNRANVPEEIKIALQQAHSYLWNLDDWRFRKRSLNLLASQGDNKLSTVDGMISKMWIDGSGVYHNDEVEHFADTTTTGRPKLYRINYDESGEAYIQLYPTPDKDYQVDVEYATYESVKVKNSLGETTSLLINFDDAGVDNQFVNIPEPIQSIYEICLLCKARLNLNEGVQSSSFAGQDREYQEALSVLKGAALNRLGSRIII